MEEAEQLCNRVGVIDYGKLIALDTPGNLVSNLGAESKVSFKVDGMGIEGVEFMTLPAVSRVENVGEGFILYTKDDNATLQGLVRYADQQGLRLRNIRTEVSNLDDVFLALTGRELRE